MNAFDPPSVLLLLVNDPVKKGAWNVVGVYLSDKPIQTIMEVQRESGLNVEERFEPIKPFGNGLECSWDESEAITADDLLPAMLYNITSDDGQFVRQFRAVALPLYGWTKGMYLTFQHNFLPDWTRA